jgi:outer membrane protein assembly factor BamE
MRRFLILLAVLCVSCGTALPTVKPYKLDVQQGNVVTSAMLLQLHPGMTKSQVRFIMGTALIQDSFHGNRWDYVYQLREGGKVIEQRRVILDFDNELLKTVRGDVIPSGSDKASAAEDIGTRVINPSGKSEAKSWISRLKFWQKDEAELAQDALAAKVKLDAEETAKKEAALAKENVVPVENLQVLKTKSLLVVPMDAPVSQDVKAVSVPPVGAKEKVAEPEAAPRAGNKTAPKPKDLPVENEPSFFDKMLEKIGF